MTTSTKFRAVAQNLTTGQRILVLPRSKKTGLFTDMKLAEFALERFGRRIGGGWRGLVYQGHDETPILHVAI